MGAQVLTIDPNDRSASGVQAGGRPRRREGNKGWRAESSQTEIDRGTEQPGGLSRPIEVRRGPDGGGDIRPQLRRPEDLHVGTPGQDPQADLDRAGHIGAPQE